MSEEVLVAFEGKESVDGRFLAYEALVLPVGAVPVTADPGSRIVGKALGFRREEDGRVYATIDLHADDVPDGWTPSLSTDLVDVDPDHEESMFIRSARIRSVHLLRGPGSMWPEMNRG
jgi:hypothetical protein